MRTFSFSQKKRIAKNSEERGFSWRYLVVATLVMGVTISGLIIQMYRWQVSGHEKFSEMARIQHVDNTRLPTSRGTIYAADGSVLAVDEPVWGVYASLSADERERQRFQENRDEFIETVAEILDLDPDEVELLIQDPATMGMEGMTPEAPIPVDPMMGGELGMGAVPSEMPMEPVL